MLFIKPSTGINFDIRDLLMETDHLNLCGLLIVSLSFRVMIILLFETNPKPVLKLNHFSRKLKNKHWNLIKAIDIFIFENILEIVHVIKPLRKYEEVKLCYGMIVDKSQHKMQESTILFPYRVSIFFSTELAWQWKYFKEDGITFTVYHHYNHYWWPHNARSRDITVVILTYFSPNIPVLDFEVFVFKLPWLFPMQYWYVLARLSQSGCVHRRNSSSGAAVLVPALHSWQWPCQYRGQEHCCVPMSGEKEYNYR